MSNRVLRALGVAAAVLLGSAPCATAADALPSRGIIGGQAVAVSAAPWQVALVDTTHTSSPRQFCGGSILDATHVVTAAHCVSSPDSWTADEIYAGTTKLSEPQQVVPVSGQQVHPAYGTPQLASDVAVLTLAEPLTLDGTSARAVELATSSPAAGAAVTVSGWGDVTNLQGFYPNQLRAVTVHTVADGVCVSEYGGSGIVTAVMLCAGEQAGGKDSCAGDSGGPLVNEGTNVLVGIVSFGNECALAGYPGVYTEVAAPTIRDFIEAAVSAPPPEPEPTVPPEPQPQPQAQASGPAAGPDHPELLLAAGADPADTTPPLAHVRRSHCSRGRLHPVDPRVRPWPQQRRAEGRGLGALAAGRPLPPPRQAHPLHPHDGRQDAERRRHRSRSLPRTRGPAASRGDQSLRPRGGRWGRQPPGRADGRARADTARLAALRWKVATSKAFLNASF